jgi:hypothetical protein
MQTLDFKLTQLILVMILNNISISKLICRLCARLFLLGNFYELNNIFEEVGYFHVNIPKCNATNVHYHKR